MVNFYFIEYINTLKPDSNMKMRFRGFLAVALLSVSILSYGISGHAFADSHNIPPVSVSAELPSYGNGDLVNLNGSIRNYDPDSDSGKAVVIRIMSPNGSLVGIGQVIPDPEGKFSHSFVAGGVLWKSAGDYLVESIFNSNVAEVTIVYTGGEPDMVTCSPDQDLINGECIDKPPPPPPQCSPDQDLINGECIDKPPPPPPQCSPDQDLINGECIDKPPQITCGEGTMLVDGSCVAVPPDPVDDAPSEGQNGCLIATAAFGSELAPQVQFLREVRDNTVMSTSSGMAFMTGFNQLYYSFSPTIADMERENPMFQEAVRAFITPMISSLSIMTLADPGSEIEVLGFGLSVIMLNLGLYIAAPALVGFKVHKHFKSKRL